MADPIDTDAIRGAWLHNNPVDVPLICRAVDRLQAANAALERMLSAALADVVNMANEETATADAHEEAVDRLRAENARLRAAIGTACTDIEGIQDHVAADLLAALEAD